MLSGLVVHQLVKAGAPFIYGTAYGALDMALMVDGYAAPEQLLTDHIGCEMAAFYRLPSFAYASVSDSKVLDTQWAAEVAFTTMLGALSRGTLLHDVGYVEAGMQSSLESIVMGDELVSYARGVLRDIPFDDEGLAVEEILRAGPGGDHLGSKYTRARHRQLWRPRLFDRAMYDRWLDEGGGKDCTERIRGRIVELAAQPVGARLDDEIIRRLDEIVGALERQRAGD